MVECHFLIPLRRDAEIADGKFHDEDAWDWLNSGLFEFLEGGTLAPGNYRGFWKNPKTGKQVHDDSRQYIVAVGQETLEALRVLLKRACRVFAQQCLYLSIAGRVEFVEPESYGHEF